MTEHSVGRVLVVEDERDVAELMRAVLEDEGYEVRVHRNGKCFDVVEAFRPDVIVCDYMLPDVDGEAVLRWLRSGTVPETHCILVSAVRRAADHWREWGADDFLPKPFDLDRLLASVARAMSSEGQIFSAHPQDNTSNERAS